MKAGKVFTSLPGSWRTSRLKFVAPLRTERGAGSASDPDYVGLENIESETGRFCLGKPLVENEKVGTGDAGATNRFVSDDVLFGKLRPYLAKAWLADRNGICTTELLVLQACTEMLGSYLRYVVLSPEFVTAVNASTFGAQMPRANWDFIGGIRVPVPSLITQEKISKFLDVETRRIDELLVGKVLMLHLLEEKRMVQISHAVIHGLDSRAPLKPSGCGWIGDIPKHWKTERAKRLLIERDDRSDAGGEEMLTVSHLTGVTPRSEKDVNMFEAESKEGYKLVSPNNLVINTLWAWMGAMGIAKHEGIVSPAYHVYRIASSLVPAYVDYLVRTNAFKTEVTRFSKGVWSSRLRLYPEGLYEIWFTVPPLEEQRAIVDYLTAEREKTLELEKSLLSSISLLKERRRALITAAVTGQLDPETFAA